MKLKLVLAIAAALVLVALAVSLAITRTTPVGVAIRGYITDVVTIVAPQPSPSPIVAHDPVTGTVTPPPVEVPTPSPVVDSEPIAFPVIPPRLVAPTAGAEPVPVAVPQTMVFVGANVEGDQHCPCKAPLTIEWLANFQGGFLGVTPTFTWSDGGTAQTDTVTYTTPGTYHSPTVVAFEVYQGVKYMVGTANANITFEIT